MPLPIKDSPPNYAVQRGGCEREEHLKIRGKRKKNNLGI